LELARHSPERDFRPAILPEQVATAMWLQATAARMALLQVGADHLQAMATR
jgi:hypothetical protein